MCLTLPPGYSKPRTVILAIEDAVRQARRDGRREKAAEIRKALAND